MARTSPADGDTLALESGALGVIARMAPLARTVLRDLPSMRRAVEYIHGHFRDGMRMSDIAAAAGVHPVHLGQAFHGRYGETVADYVKRLRVRSAAEQLCSTTAPIASIAHDHGFFDQSHFQRTFKNLVGVTPASFRLQAVRE
jgi:AraC-like DNA-binding protein